MILAISSCPRIDGISYTEDTLVQVLANGGVPEGTPIIVWDDIMQEGSAHACHSLLKQCALDYPGQDVLLLEDDVRCCANAVKRIVDLPFPADCDMISFYNNRIRFTREEGAIDVDAFIPWSPKIVKSYEPIAGVYFEPANSDFSYSQALLLSAKLVAHIAAAPRPDENTIGLSAIEYGIKNSHTIRDRVLGFYAGHISERIAYVIPNWFEHVGDVSSVLPDPVDPHARCKQVSAGNFLSFEHDAMTDDITCEYQGLPRPWFY